MEAKTWKKWGPEGWSPEGWGPEGWSPEGWGAQNFALFFPPPATVSLFLCLFGCLLVEFWWCLKRRGPEMCTFGVLGLSCASPGLQKHHQNSTKGPPREREERKKFSSGRREKKKREILGPQPLGAPTFLGSGPHPFGPPPSGQLRAPSPLGPHPQGPNSWPSGPSLKQKIGQMRSGQIRSTQNGQIRPNKDGQMRPINFGHMWYWPNSVWPNAVTAKKNARGQKKRKRDRQNKK